MSPGSEPSRGVPDAPRIGLVLGSGSARGWAHLGVLKALQREGIRPDILCGCSIGAFVGAAAAAGDLDKLIDWVRGLHWKSVVSLMDVSLRSGLIRGDRLMEFFERNFVDRDFSQLAIPFACVATDLASGREIWLKEGGVAEAVRASIALPGLLTPVQRDGRLLVDGGLVNPVPVSLCRAMGADLVIAVDLGSDIIGRALRRSGNVADERSEEGMQGWLAKVFERLRPGGEARDNGERAEDALPSLVTVMTASINIMQIRIARSRLAGEPADVLISPRLGQIGMLDYHRGAEAIAEGEAAVLRVLPALRHALA